MPRQRTPLLTLPLLILPLVLAGCATPSGAPGDIDTAAADEATAAPPTLEEPTVVARYEFGVAGYEMSILCIFGEGPELTREAPVAPGTASLAFTVDPGASNGIRAGYALDGGDIVWLPVVTGPPQTFVVPLEEGQHETTGTRWTFHYQPNLPDPATQECYTGIAAGPHSILVEARPE